MRVRLHLQGLYQDKPPLPFIPGSEVSGIVTEVGAKVKSVKQGDHVCPFHISHDQPPFQSYGDCAEPASQTTQQKLQPPCARAASQACCRCVP